MSKPSASEHFVSVCDHARRLAERAAHHADDLCDLVRATETEVRRAEAALLRARDPAGMDADEMQRVCSSRLNDCLDHAAAARRACISASQHHASARRLLSRLDPEYAALRPNEHCVPVLVVDDVEDVRDRVAEVLQGAGFTVRTAVNGLDGLFAAYEMHPAVIVMDLAMPVLGGIEATRLIKAADATRDAKVIAYTADPKLADGWREHLFVAVLPKPSDPDLVLATVQNVAQV